MRACTKNNDNGHDADEQEQDDLRQRGDILKPGEVFVGQEGNGKADNKENTDCKLGKYAS